MRRQKSELEQACDAALRKCLPANLVATIRRLLEAGQSPRQVLAACRQAGASRRTFTGLAIEAEIETIAAEIQARKN